MKTIDFTSIETWAHGLFAAAIMSGSDTGAAILGSYFGKTNIQWHQLFVSMGISSLVAAFFYLKKSPLPNSGLISISPEPDSKTTTTIVTEPSSVPSKIITSPISKP